MAHSGRDIGKGALGLVAGTIIGAGVALLFAPNSGENTRRDILHYSKKGRRKARRIVEDFSDSVADMVDDIMEKGKDVAHETKRGILEAIEEGQEKLGHQRERLERLIG